MRSRSGGLAAWWTALLACAALSALPRPAHAASSGATSLFTARGSSAGTTAGDYVSDTLGLNTFYRFFIEVPPGLPRLRVQLFDPDVGVGGTGEANAGRDRTVNTFNTTAKYTLLRPDGTTAATLTCDASSCLDNAWQSLLDSTAAADLAAGHWELRVDQSSAATTGDDVNAFGVRADDGDPTPSGQEIPVYVDSLVPFGVNPPASGTNSRSYTLYPYVTSGCSCSANDFDWDSNAGNTGSLLFTSRTGVFTESVASSALSASNAWARNVVSGFTSDYAADDYGVFSVNASITSYVDVNGQNGNIATFYAATYAAAVNPPASNPAPNAFRLYLPTDAGAAPIKPYVSQTFVGVLGPDPPAAGQTTRVEVTVTVTNPTSRPITFSAANTVVATVPGGGTLYAGNASVSQGVVVSQPAVGGTGSVTWNPGTVPAGLPATLKYRVNVTPSAAGQRVPVTATPASGNGTRALWLDETGNAAQSRAMVTFGPLCELALTEGLLIPSIPLVETPPANQTVCPGATATFTASASLAFAVKWQKSTNGGTTFADVPGATTTTLSFTAALADDQSVYRAVFSNAYGTATTSSAVLTVADVEAPAVTPPSDLTATQTVCQ